MKKFIALASVTAFAGFTAFGQGQYSTTISTEIGNAPTGQNWNLGDGDPVDQSYDLAGIKVPETVGTFGSLGGGIHVNWHSSGLYIGLQAADTGGNNNFMLFIDVNGGGVASLAGLGDGVIGGGGIDFDHFDNAENMNFGTRQGGGNFRPEIGILAGDEWGDATFSSFGRPGISLDGGSGDTGMGVVDLANSTLGGAFATVAGSRIQQFDTAIQVADDADANQNTDYLEVFIPAAALTGFGFSLNPGSTLEIAAIVAGGDDGNPGQAIFFSTSGAYGAGSTVGTGAPNTLNSLQVTLGAVPEPSTFSLLALSVMSFAAIRRKVRR